MIGLFLIVRRCCLRGCAAFMHQRAAIIVICRNSFFGMRPFGQDGEEAGDVHGDLPGFLAAQDRARGAAAKPLRASDQLSFRLSFAACDSFTEDLTGGSSPFRAPGLRSRNPTDDAGP